MSNRVLGIPRVFNMLELYKVVNIPRLYRKIHGILYVLSFEYAKVLNLTGALIC